MLSLNIRRFPRQGWFAFIAVFLAIISAAAASAVDPGVDESVLKKMGSSKVMREVDELKKSGDTDEAKKTDVTEKLRVLEQAQKKRLDRLGVSSAKQERYFRQIEIQQAALSAKSEKPPSEGKESGFFEKLFGGDDKKVAIPIETEKEFLIPKKPGAFSADKSPVEVKKLDNLRAKLQAGQRISKLVASLVNIDTAQAVEDNVLPAIEDVREDGAEIVITQEMRTLVKTLDHNPVKITEWVRNNIRYEPYFGAKKGAKGCIAERVCNDVDGSSLALALLRAAGIPARYERSIAITPVATLRNLLGVDETKTVFLALSRNKVPVFTLTDPPDADFEQVDFANDTHLAVGWTHVQAFYDFDHRGANSANALSFDGAQSTDDVRALLRTSLKKQWIPLDVVMKPYTRTRRDILVDAAGFNSENFWSGFFQYQGEFSPILKYIDDLQRATGRQIADALSTKTPVQERLTSLPSALPYVVASGQADDQQFERVVYSRLPNEQRDRFTLEIQRAANDETVWRRTFFSTEINNVPLELFYEGATDVDKAVINEHGGIHETPAALVDIVPAMRMNEADIFGVNEDGVRPTATIGESLQIVFRYENAGGNQYEDQKISTAGNREGIYIVTSRVQEDALLDNQDNPDRYEQTTALGTTAIAREYLKRIEAEDDVLKESLDHEYNYHFARAVVTQNRILREVDGLPTTFEFKGLSLDASGHIVSYSNRGNYHTHEKDFLLISGLGSSFQESRTFEDVLGLESVSTAKGLQYASAHPETYTVHRITQANKNVIDTLNLSPNTLQNMHADVRAGNTIFTPNRLVEIGTWRGILYVSLRPTWDGTYAIGEQAQQNGGISRAQFLSAPYENERSDVVETKVAFVPAVVCDNAAVRVLAPTLSTIFLKRTLTCAPRGDSYMNFEEFPAQNGANEDIYCRIRKDTSDALIATQQANGTTYLGRPCQTGTPVFGDTQHHFEHFTNGAHLVGRNLRTDQILYNYNVLSQAAKDAISRVAGDRGKAHKFNIIAGTYSRYLGRDGTVYYQPTSNGAAAWLVSGDILSKLQEASYKDATADENNCGDGNGIYCGRWAGKKNWVLYKVGYPIGTELRAARSQPFESDGTYQNFIGGQLYTDETWLDESYYVPAQIGREYGGTATERGFPVDDPRYNSQDNMVFQDFENGDRIKFYFNNGRIVVDHHVETIGMLRNYTDPVFRDDLKEGFLDAFAEGGIVGLAIDFAAGFSLEQAWNIGKKFLIDNKKLRRKALVKLGIKIFPVVGWVFTGVTTAIAIDQAAQVFTYCNSDPDQFPTLEAKAPAYYCGKLFAQGLLTTVGVGISKATNALGVSSAIARRGKAAFLARVDSNNWLIMKGSIAGSKNRDAFFTMTNRISADDVARLTQRPDVVTRFIKGEATNLQTLNGFSTSPQTSGLVKYRVHPGYSRETPLYTQPNQFGFTDLQARGFTRPGFYGENDIDDLMDMYRRNNFGAPAANGHDTIGEIIFVKKMDGTLVLSGRLNDLGEGLPHPYLSGGQDVVSAGIIYPDPVNPRKVIIRNKSGHFRVQVEDLASVANQLRSRGYEVGIKDHLK